MQEVISETLVDSIPKDGLFDILLHYGLFLGALFQLVCIFAVTFVPASDDENVSSCSGLCSGSARLSLCSALPLHWLQPAAPVQALALLVALTVTLDTSESESD